MHVQLLANASCANFPLGSEFCVFFFNSYFKLSRCFLIIYTLFCVTLLCAHGAL